jgi:hypothetical protein
MTAYTGPEMVIPDAHHSAFGRSHFASQTWSMTLNKRHDDSAANKQAMFSFS